MFLSEAINDYELSISGGSHSEATQDLYLFNLGLLLDAVGDSQLSNLSTKDLRKWQADMAMLVKRGELSVFTLHQRIRTIQTFFNWCVAETDVPLAMSPADNLRMPRLPKNRPPKNISDLDLARMLDACSSDFRVSAIVHFLADTNCRVSGLIGLTQDRLRIDKNEATVVEKGAKARTVYFNGDTERALRRWLIMRPWVKYDEVFLSRSKKPLTRFGVAGMLKRLGERAGVVGPHNAHSFRHAWARRALEAGIDLSRVSRMMGHTNIEHTAAYYTCWCEDDLSRAAREHDTLSRVKSI